MVDLPGLPGKLDLNPFNNGEGKPKKGTARWYKEKGERWDGEGAPPSRDAAIGFLLRNGVRSVAAAKRIVGESGTLTKVGGRVRNAVADRDVEQEEFAQEWRRQHPKPAGEVSAEEIATAAEEGGPDAVSELLGMEIGGPEAADSRGAPLWRYSGDPETLAEIEVENKSGPSTKTGGARWLADRRKHIGARYYEADTLSPLKWSAEQRADLQRVFHGLGLYGNDKVQLGKWTAKDQALFAELLASSNEEGRIWTDQLAEWKRNPPTDLIEEAEGEKRAPLVVQHTNPTDIRTAAREVSRNLTGEVDRGFLQSSVGGYQAQETAAQTAAYNAADPDGGGGTVTDAPSVGAYLDESLRRSDPIKVDGYQFLNQFQTFMAMLGVS